jgi:hypothetical protein
MRRCHFNCVPRRRQTCHERKAISLAGSRAGTLLSDTCSDIVLRVVTSRARDYIGRGLGKKEVKGVLCCSLFDLWAFLFRHVNYVIKLGIWLKEGLRSVLA